MYVHLTFGLGCTDIDDALHVRALDNGNYEVGVRKSLLQLETRSRIVFTFSFLDIADVTYFVKPGMAMDEEAAKRGTTVYLVDKRIDMLPALLGTSKS